MKENIMFKLIYSSLKIKRIITAALVILLTMLSLQAMQGEELEEFLVDKSWTDGPYGTGGRLVFLMNGEFFLRSGDDPIVGSYTVEGDEVSFAVNKKIDDKSYRFMKKVSYRFVVVSGEESPIQQYLLEPVKGKSSRKAVKWQLVVAPPSTVKNRTLSWEGYKLETIYSSRHRLKEGTPLHSAPSTKSERYYFLELDESNYKYMSDFSIVANSLPGNFCNILGTTVVDGKRWYLAYFSVAQVDRYRIKLGDDKFVMNHLVGWVRAKNIIWKRVRLRAILYTYSPDTNFVLRSNYDGKEYRPYWKKGYTAHCYHKLPDDEYSVIVEREDGKRVELEQKVTFSQKQKSVEINLREDELLFVMNFDLPQVAVSVKGRDKGWTEFSQREVAKKDKFGRTLPLKRKRRAYSLKRGSYKFSLTLPGYKTQELDIMVGEGDFAPGKIYKMAISFESYSDYGAMLAALQSGNLLTIKEQLKAGALLDAPVEDDLCAMSWLLRERKWALAGSLLKEYGDINRPISSANSDSLLFRAVKDRNLEAIKFLLNRGALLYYRLENRDEISILNYVVERNDRELVELFSKSGQNFKVPELADAIVVAAQQGSLELVRLFHESGLSVDMARIPRNEQEKRSRQFEETALMAAVKSGHNRVVSYLLNNFALPKLKYNGAGHYENGNYFNSYELALIHKNSEALKMIEALYDFHYQVKLYGDQNDIELELRGSPSMKGALKGSLKRGELVRIVEFAQRDNYYDSDQIWVKVEREDKSRVWCLFYKLILY